MSGYPTSTIIPQVDGFSTDTPGFGVSHREFLGRLAFGPNPFGDLGLGRLTRGTELGPMVPIMPPFSRRGERSSPVEKKKRNNLDRHIIGNSRPSMLLNFQRKFCKFFETALDAIGSFELILRFRGSYKRLVG